MEARLDIAALVRTGVEAAATETFDFPEGAGPFPEHTAKRERVAPPQLG
jgi:hypothetical protein